MAVVAVCIAYIQLTVTQCGIFIEYAIFQNYVADFAFGCGYFAVFIYNQFAVGSIECAVAVYEERHSAVFICSTYGQVVFGIQYIGLNGVCIRITIFIYREFAVCCIKCAVAVYEERRSTICFCSTYCYTACCYFATCPDSAFAAADAYKSVRIISFKINIFLQSNLIFLATVFIGAFGYSNISTIGNSNISVAINIWRSHRRSHACTGHNTCCNQHCQQLFGRAAFTAMIFCNFGDNNVCVARLTPNYFKNFVHQKFLPHKYYYIYCT